jgi:hypothetical protein
MNRSGKHWRKSKKLRQVGQCQTAIHINTHSRVLRVATPEEVAKTNEAEVRTEMRSGKQARRGHPPIVAKGQIILAL